jgi:hypothetical protein
MSRRQFQSHDRQWLKTGGLTVGPLDKLFRVHVLHEWMTAIKLNLL